MAGLTALLAAALAAASPAGALEVARLSGAAADGTALSAVISRGDQSEATALRVYSSHGAVSRLIYTHPAAGEIQRFVGVRIPGRLPDFFGDGVPTVVYVSENPAFDRSTLFVLRYQAPYFVRVGSFPGGRLEDLGNDGQTEIVSQDRPLGRFFSIRCGGFETTAAKAVATTVLRWNGREFVSTGDAFPDFWRQREDTDVAALDEAAPEKREKPGIYLSRALTVFYDESAQNRKQSGWKELSRRLAESGAPSSCLADVRTQLRKALDVPADWP